MTRIIAACLLLSACDVVPDVPGQIVAMNSQTVTIRSGGDFGLVNAGKGFKPTPSVVKQAQAVCPNAKFASGVGVDGPAFLVDYLFLC